MAGHWRLPVLGVVGLLAGYLGGWTDTIVTRIADIVLALPPFLLVLVIIAGFGTGEFVIVVAVAAVATTTIVAIASPFSAGCHEIPPNGNASNHTRAKAANAAAFRRTLGPTGAPGKSRVPCFD